MRAKQKQKKKCKTSDNWSIWQANTHQIYPKLIQFQKYHLYLSLGSNWLYISCLWHPEGLVYILYSHSILIYKGQIFSDVCQSESPNYWSRNLSISYNHGLFGIFVLINRYDSYFLLQPSHVICMKILRLCLAIWTYLVTTTSAVKVEVPPLDEWKANVWGSYYENTVLWPDGEIINEDRNFILTVMRILNEYMRRILGPLIFGLLIYFWFQIITSSNPWDDTKTKIKSIAKIIIGLLVIILTYTVIRFVVNLY